MEKMFKLKQIKGKWHKFPSFNLEGGAKLYKNFVQKLLAVSLCMAVVLLGTPVMTFADGVMFTVDKSSGIITAVNGVDELSPSITITIPATYDGVTIKGVAPGVFDSYANLTRFQVSPTHPYLSVGSSGELLGRTDASSADFNVLYRLPPAYSTQRKEDGVVSFRLPDTVTEIKSGAFANCSELMELDFSFEGNSGRGDLTWGDYSFAGCTSLAGFSLYRGSFVGYGAYLSREEDADSSTLVRVAPAFAGVVQLGDGLNWSVAPGALSGCSSVSALWPPGTNLATDVTSAFFSRMSGAPVLVPAAFVDAADTSDNITISADAPASVFGYEVDSSDATKLLITSRSGNPDKQLTLACNTFAGYTLAVGENASIDNLTITHSGAPGTTCSECSATIPTVPVTGVDLRETTKTLTVGESFGLTARVSPENATNKALEWWVDNRDVAAFVDDNGAQSQGITTADGTTHTVTVTGLSAGNTTITVRSADDPAFSAYCDVYVTSADSGSGSVSPGVSVPPGGSVSPEASDGFSYLFSLPPLEQTVSATIGGVEATQRVRLYDPDENLPAGATLRVTPSSEATLYLDSKHQVEHLIGYDISLVDENGTPLAMPLEGPVILLFEVVDGLDLPDLEVVWAEPSNNREFTEIILSNEGTRWIGVLTNHFSPYVLIDTLSSADAAVLAPDSSADSAVGSQQNAKTGDLPASITIAAFTLILVSSLGIMLMLISSKKKLDD